MNPVVVIGTGGSGKWVATDLKLAAVDMRNRELLREHGESARQRPDWDTLPPEIQILTVDVSKADHHPVIRHDAFRSEFSLDYTEASDEFVDISASFGTVIKEISEGRPQDFARISAWLSKSDANCYDVRRLPASTGNGAGQLRQLGRTSLFVALQGKHTLLDRIGNAIQRAAAARTDNSKITIFVCGSLAGGTGSGIMWDIAALARHYAESVVPDRYDVVGFVVLPGAFRRIASSGAVERVRMAANTYAGLRELTRLMDSQTRTTFGYNANLEVRLDHPIFSVAYLVEGSRPSGYDLAVEQPHFGTYPSIADAILLHAATTVDLTQVRSQMVQHPEGVFSTTGAVQWILPVEEIIYEAGHSLAKLSLESLLWAQQATETVPPPEAQQRADAAAAPRREKFFTSTGSGSFNLVRFVNVFLGQLRLPRLSTSMMMQQVRFNDRNRDRDLPELALADLVELAPRMSKGDPAGVKQQVEDLVARMTGGATDELESGHITVHAVLNHYQMLHEQAFRDYLDAETVDALNSTASGAGKSVRPGGLLHTEAFLKSVHDRLEDFCRRFTEGYQEEQRIDGSIVTRLQRARQELDVAEGAMLTEKSIRDRIGRRIRQADYLKRAQTVYDLTIQNLVHSRIFDIAEAWLAILGRQRAAVQGWNSTFRQNIETLGAEVRDIQSRRLENIRIRSRRYVSEPGDNFETDLFNSCLNVSDPQDVIGSEGVASLLRQLYWTWSDGELILLVPNGSAQASDRLMWQQDGLSQHKYRCFETFASIRRTTIWDAFQRLGYDESRLHAELLGLMEP
ncbi:MAG: tubulin-like doman-containing protein, partial [Sciscionella sp.]